MATIPTNTNIEKIPPHRAAYDLWNQKQTPENLAGVVTHLQPTIDGVLRSISTDQDRALRGKARVLAARAVKTYDPRYGAALPTWVSQQLQPLKRFKRTSLMPVRVPERIQLDALSLMQAEQEFKEKHDREPDVEELADFAKMPIRRIQAIKQTFRRVAPASAFGENPSMPEAQQTDHSDEALEYVYRDADRIDRRIIEMKTGYGGNFDPMEPSAIALRLQLSPVQLSRRSARMAAKLQELREAITQVS